jgi:hypothetical protein
MTTALITDDIFETETMAELCARQGRLGEAVTIFRHLLASAPRSPARARWQARLAELESHWQPAGEGEVAPADIPLPPVPGVNVQTTEDAVTVAWALPASTPAPALEVFFVQRTPGGIETTKRTLPLDSPSGRRGFAVPGLHSAIAAAGTLVEGRFVPVARSGRG